MVAKSSKIAYRRRLFGRWRLALDKRSETYSLHIGVRAFTAFGDEAVDPRRDNGQRYRAELEHGITFCEVRIKKDELRSR